MTILYAMKHYRTAPEIIYTEQMLTKCFWLSKLQMLFKCRLKTILTLIMLFYVACHLCIIMC